MLGACLANVYMRKFLLTFLALLSAAANAYDVQIDGIYYNLNSSTKSAEVTYGGYQYQGTEKYTGDIVIPSTVTYKGITFSVTSIGREAFFSCHDLISISIPNSVTIIMIDAFHGCRGLTSVNIPNSVTSLGHCAFQNCSSLTSIDLPNSVRSIGMEAFDGCI